MIQEVDDGPAAQERFFREARAMAAVKSDNIVAVYQVGTIKDVPYLAMEYLHGEPLAAWLKPKAHPVYPKRCV